MPRIKNKDSLSLPFELGVERTSREDPTPIPAFDSSDEELDPVCTVEFAHHARTLDRNFKTGQR